ncbi:pilus assembly protein TadB [Alicyclobacillus macrosporangiidus]|uniref:pilus assembly protein TadB n=1 Tax=Alicyclobacillus macrosporangiidus TaxID=392015 RepID=UPI000A545208|nr:pilus assembly protein TadB [Alicyclobacillus macrosporangiidus]
MVAVIAILLGVLMFLAVFVVVWGFALVSAQEEQLRIQSIRGTYKRATPKAGFLEAMHRDMVRYAKEIGKPGWADIAYRVSFAMPLLVAAVALLVGWYWALPLALLAFFLPYLYLERTYRRARLLLRRQLRQARLLIALLAEAGAPVERGIVAAEAVSGYPLKPYLRDVCIAIGQVPTDTHERERDTGMRVQTVVEAFMQMAERLKLSEATQFAQLLAQSTRYNTPLTDMMFTSLEIEERLRDAEAEAKYNNAISKISYLSTLGLGIPVFAYMFLAVFSYLLQLLGGAFGFGSL